MDDDIEMIHKEGGGEKEEERLKGDGGNNVGEVEEREGDASLEASSPLDRILLLTPKTTSKTTITKRVAWWEYVSYGYAKWDT